MFEKSDKRVIKKSDKIFINANHYGIGIIEQDIQDYLSREEE